MAISIGDALLKLGIDKKDFDRDMKSLGAQIKQHQKAIGIGAAAMGTAIVAGLGMSLKAAAEEEAGIARLEVAMRNMGLSYEESRESLEEWIDTMQQKTSVADDEQRTALSQLIRMTGDLDSAQEKLTLAMDVAAGTGKDLASANQLVMYAMGGNWGMVERYIPALKKVQDEEQKWSLLREMFAGQAEEFGETNVGMLKTIQNNMGDISEMIGGVLMPVLSNLSKTILPILQNIKKWTELHPGMTKAIVIGTAALGGLLIAFGSILLLLPALTAALPLLGLAFHAALGPIGLITLAITGLIAVGVALWKNWEKVTGFFRSKWGMVAAYFLPIIGIPMLIISNWGKIVGFFKTLWVNVKIIFLKAVDAILASLQRFVGFLPGLGDKIADARESITNMIDNAEVQKRAILVGKTIEQMADDAHARMEAAYQDISEESEMSADDMIRDLRNVTREARETARERTQTELDAIDERMDATRDAHDERMDQLQEEFDATIANIDAELGATVKGYGDEIDAIDDQLDQMDKLKQQERDSERIAELQAAIQREDDAGRRQELIEELADFEDELRERQIKDQLRDKKAELRELQNIARQQARTAKDEARKTYDYERELEEQKVTDTIARLEKQKTQWEAALQETLTRFDTEQQAFETMLSNEEHSMAEYVREFNRLVDSMKKGITFSVTKTGGGGAPAGAIWGGPETGWILPGGGAYTGAGRYTPPALQHGGIVTRPITATVGERGPEAVIPLARAGAALGGYKTANFTIELNGRVLAQILGKEIVDFTRIKTGTRI